MHVYTYQPKNMSLFCSSYVASAAVDLKQVENLVVLSLVIYSFLLKLDFISKKSDTSESNLKQNLKYHNFIVRQTYSKKSKNKFSFLGKSTTTFCSFIIQKPKKVNTAFETL